MNRFREKTQNDPFPHFEHNMNFPEKYGLWQTFMCLITVTRNGKIVGETQAVYIYAILKFTEQPKILGIIFKNMTCSEGHPFIIII